MSADGGQTGLAVHHAYTKQLVRVAKLSCFFLGVIAFILFVWFFSRWIITGTITLRP
jgi:hypothetical protein